MMNYIWGFILIFSVIYGLFSGNIDKLEKAFSESSMSAVTFVFNFCGIMAMWSGLMNIAEKTGLINKVSHVLMPLTKIIFPKQNNPQILSSIIMSFMSNILGAGNSSTVFALKTMEKLDKENKASPIASDDMCTFAIVNMAFAPIFPVMIIQMRKTLGAVDPYSTLLPSLITSILTIIISILACKYYERK